MESPERVNPADLVGKWIDSNGWTIDVMDSLAVYTRCQGKITSKAQVKTEKGKVKLEKRKLLQLTETKAVWTGSRGKHEEWTRVAPPREPPAAPEGSTAEPAPPPDALPPLGGAAPPADPTTPAPPVPPSPSAPEPPKSAPVSAKAARPSAASKFDNKYTRERAAKLMEKAQRSRAFMHGGYHGRRLNASSDDESDDGGARYPLVTLSVESALNTPSRLTENERRMMRVVRNVVRDSSYTDVVDSPLFAEGISGAPEDAPKRMQLIITELKRITSSVYVCAVAASALDDGLSTQSRVSARDTLSMPQAVKQLKSNDLENAVGTFTKALEIGRRYKIANPEDKTMEYGKLLYIAQDFFKHVLGEGDGGGSQASSSSGEEGGVGGGEDGVSEGAPATRSTRIVTIRDRLGAAGVDEAFLSDPRIHLATTPVPRLEDTRELNAALRRKTKVIEQLARKYAGGGSPEDVKQLIYALGDRNVGITQNVQPVVLAIGLLKKFFSPSATGEGVASDRCLAIQEGAAGSRLTHEHEKQYFFVLQSLTFWKHILTDMSHLWVVMEEDLLSSECVLRHTGQGVNRVVQCPNLYEAVQRAVSRAKEDLGGWVGSDRVHMGDHQVPNGLHFIDKYTQIPCILQPIINTLAHLDHLGKKDPVQKRCMEGAWGSIEALQVAILRDFFRSGFDGSGGDTDDDAGSCVDGRLTSAWNWCSLLRTKPFYPAFLLSGFSSF